MLKMRTLMLSGAAIVATSILPLSFASAQLPVGHCLNMPEDGTIIDEQEGCNTGQPDPDPRDVGNYGQSSRTSDPDDGGENIADLIEAAAAVAPSN